METTSVTKDQFLTSLRYVIVAAGSFAAGKGYISSDMLNAILQISAIFGPLAWGLYVNWQKAQQTKVVQAAGVQAGINLVLAGEAKTVEGTPITAIGLQGAPAPLPVTVATADQIVKEHLDPTQPIPKE